jgi:hypothetical protein
VWVLSRVKADPVYVFEYEDQDGVTQFLSLADFAPSSSCLTDQVADALVNEAIAVQENSRRGDSYMEVLSKPDRRLAIVKARDILKSEDARRMQEARNERRRFLQAQLEAVQRGLQELDNAGIEVVQGE